MGRIRTRILAMGPGVLLIMLLVGPSSALAQDPSLDVSQYAHTAWRIRDGFSKGPIRAIAQTPDGYLWLGTDFGLLRFDGVKNTLWQPPAGLQLPSEIIHSLLVARDGTLWIGTPKGLASWEDGKLTQYPELTGKYVSRLLEDHEASVWVGTLGFPAGELCAIRSGKAQCNGDDGRLGYGVLDLYEDSKGNLWAGVKDGLWRWKPGPPKFYPLSGLQDAARGLTEDTDGALLVGQSGGIRRFIEGKSEPYSLRGISHPFRVEHVLRDRSGDLWIGTQENGLLHVHQGKTDAFLPADGLSGTDITALFQDREGDLWVGTSNGLDRFRDFSASTVNANEGLSSAIVGSVLTDMDGSIWLSTYGGLDRSHNGQITTYNKRDGKLNGEIPNSLFQDNRGRIWVSTRSGFGYLEKNQFTAVSGVPGGPVHGIVEDTERNLWIANQNDGLFQLADGGMTQHIPWTSLGHKDHADALTADISRGGLWLGFYEGGVAYFKNGQVRESYSTADGLGGGRVASLRMDRDGTIWAATEGGLSRFKNGRFATLTSKNGLPCDYVFWTIQDDDQALWLNTPCGLVRIARSEMDTWTAAVDRDNGAKPIIRSTVFDISDGVRSLAMGSGYTPAVSKTSDGKIWFVAGEGVSVFDPRHLPYNKIPPPVHIEQLTADRKTYDSVSQLRLPPRIRDLEIDYTGLSYVAPEKNRFRYKLEGRDRDWQDVGNRRQAFYSDLPPGKYRFRVTAANNSGVWNEAGTFLDFSIAPAYYQTIWFRMICVVTFLLLLWGLYQLRVHQLAREFNMGVEARVSERTRIARDLHDTLLQSFQGLLLRFQTVSQILPEGNAKQTLDSAIEQAAQAITEGRDAVQDLRSPTAETSDLAEAIRTLGEEIASVETNRSSIVFRVDVEGKPRNVHPILRDEIYRIAGEALRNAFNHARASQIEVEIRYDDRQFRLRVRDDGKGIDPKVLGGNGRAGHFGLHGMRERAKLMGGNLAVWSELNSGTEVELSVPASNAYSSSSGSRTTGIFKKLGGKGTQVKS